MRINLHNHTTYSDGAMAPEELARTAVGAGLSHLGITDHFQTTKLPIEGSVPPDQVATYAEHVRRVADQYSGQIHVLAGLEIDFNPLRTDLPLVRSMARTGAFAALDYVLFEYVGETGNGTLSQFLNLRSEFSIPVGLAHVFLPTTFGSISPESLARQLTDADVFFEVCVNPRWRQLGSRRPDATAEMLLRDLEYFSAELARLKERAEVYPDDDTVQDQTAEVETILRMIRTDIVEIWPFDDAGPFCEAFWSEAPRQRLLLSIGTDTHSSASEVGAVQPGIDFLRQRGLLDLLVTSHKWTTPRTSAGT